MWNLSSLKRLNPHPWGRTLCLWTLMVAGVACSDTGDPTYIPPSPTPQATVVDPTPTPTAAPETPRPGTDTPDITAPPTVTPTAPPTPVPTAAPDLDGDGSPRADDCDDNNAAVYPDAPEVCDGIDNDCDEAVDDADNDTEGRSTWYLDLDKDGFGNADLATLTACVQPLGYVDNGDDCNDLDDLSYPGAEETCEDTEDLNCDGAVGFEDLDGDSFAACEECNDGDVTINPEASEVCDGSDNDCDGAVDDDDTSLSGASTWYLDDDGDTYGTAEFPLVACTAPDEYVANEDDCNDQDSAINPATVWHLDQDSDGYGDDGITLVQCGQPLNFALTGGDCDDDDNDYYPGAPGEQCDDPNDYNCDGVVSFSDEDDDGFAACEECDDVRSDINPAAEETCDGQDNDCDEAIDIEDDDVSGTIQVWSDGDGDGYGGAGEGVSVCESGDTQVLNDDDCNDADGAINPDTIWYIDRDGDGFGDATVTRTQCTQPTSFVRTTGDCNDLDKNTYPGATETCTDTQDRNCDGSVGAVDDDGDGFAACEDCDDGDAAVNEDAVEVCDGQDNDCDQLADDADTNVKGGTTWYQDADGDGYGTASKKLVSCLAPSGYVENDDDCNDNDININPDTLWYPDLDGDDHGNGNGQSVRSCTQPGPLYAADGDDCDDSAATVYPGAPEGCSGEVDFNCDGAVDNDGDGDGYAASTCGGTDCDDTDPSIKPEPGGGCALGVSCLVIRDSEYNVGSGLYTIDPDGRNSGEDPIEVYCDMTTDGGGWTLVQRTMWSWTDSQKLLTDYAGWYTSTLGSAQPGMAFRAAGYFWPLLDTSKQVLLALSVRTTDGGACRPLYYRATDTTFSANPAKVATVDVASQTATIFNSSSLSTTDSGPSVSCVSGSLGAPWFYSSCCTTCPTYKGGYWTDEPHPMQPYTGSSKDIFGKVEVDVCGAKLVKISDNGSSYRGVDTMEVYIR